jgi:hypothetical protein
MRLIILFLVFVFFVPSANILAQGCSDAGFCTLGNIKPHGADSSTLKKQNLTLLLSNGIGDEGVYVFTPGIQYDIRFSKYWALQAKLTANYASGNLGTAFGLGDGFVSGIYSPKTSGKWATSFILGGKFPLNLGDIKNGNKPLPMQYQSSLGTIDVIAGITLSNNKWTFATAIQQPLTGTNGNTFLPIYWGTAEAAKYAPTNDFNRKADVLLRANYDVKSTKKWKVNAGLLGIYHLGKDTYIDGNVSNQPIALQGSEGLTLNGTLSSWYNASSKFSLGFTAGVPFVVRNIRPDGLTRSFVVSPEIIFHF